MSSLGAEGPWARFAGIVVGLLAAAACFAVWEVPAGSGVVGADVEFSAQSSGELALDPAGTFLVVSDLRPSSEPRSGAVTVRNQTGSSLAVRIVARPSSRDLDAALRIEVRAGAERLLFGSLGDLRASAPPFEIPAGSEERLSFRVWLPIDAVDYERRATEVGIAFVTRVAQ